MTIEDSNEFIQILQKFTDGITNKLVGCFYNPATRTSDNSEKCNNNQENSQTLDDSNDSGHLSSHDDSVQNVVLIRVYGNKTDLLIDREKEIENIKLLHSYGFAPTLYATFLNGLAYEFVPGVTLNRNNVLEPELWTLVAKRMAEMHRVVRTMTPPVDAGQQQPKPMLLKKIERFFELVPEQYSDKRKHNR